ADSEKPMAEGVDATAIDVGHRAIGADAEVAGHQLHADHGTGLEVGWVAHGPFDFAAGSDALAGFQAEGVQLGSERVERGACETAERHWGSDIDHARIGGWPRWGRRLRFGDAAREVPFAECHGGA